MSTLTDIEPGAPAGHSLIALLSVPYLIEASTTQLPSGTWVRRAAYPELDGCITEAPGIEEALYLLERRRIEIIIAMVTEGVRPPMPRPPLTGGDPRAVAEELGLSALLNEALRAEQPAVRHERTSHDAVAR